MMKWKEEKLVIIKSAMAITNKDDKRIRSSIKFKGRAYIHLVKLKKATSSHYEGNQ